MNLDYLATAQDPPVTRPGGVSMHDVAIALHARRRRDGVEVYSSLLQAANGRVGAIDRLQEDLDGLVYGLQVLCEQQALAEALADYRASLAELDAIEATAGAALGHFDAVFSPAALAARADAVAQRLIGEAVGERLVGPAEPDGAGEAG